MISVSDDPEDGVDETAGINNNEFCVDPERAAEAQNPDGLFNTREIPADPERALEPMAFRLLVRFILWILT